jgi:hypothetical protein
MVSRQSGENGVNEGDIKSKDGSYQRIAKYCSDPEWGDPAHHLLMYFATTPSRQVVGQALVS